MSNLEILREIQKIYDPKTAFGNSEILDLFKKIVKPNKDGNFEVEGYVERIVRIQWRCVDCGRYHEDDEDIFDKGDKIGRKCGCGAKHVIDLIN